MTENDINHDLPVPENENAVPITITGEVNDTDTLAELTPEDKLKDAEDRYLRLYADFENYKRRNSKERYEWMQSAGKEILTAMVPVLDDFYRARKQMETATDMQAVKDGVELIFNKFKSTLENKGLTEMVSLGQPFDADKHEAITEIPAPTADLKGKVVDEIEKGYLLNDKILRYAKVVVGK